MSIYYYIYAIRLSFNGYNKILHLAHIRYQEQLNTYHNTENR
jgi:hypothetical protein